MVIYVYLQVDLQISLPKMAAALKAFRCAAEPPCLNVGECWAEALFSYKLSVLLDLGAMSFGLKALILSQFHAF